MNNLIHFSAVEDQSYGGKADSLASLFAQKFNVPQGFIIPASLIENYSGEILKGYSGGFEGEREIIEAKSDVFSQLISNSWNYVRELFDNNTSIAVRSSANLEDGSKTSFAGMFNTILDVKDAKAFGKAVLDCLLSKYNPEVIAYCKRKKIDPREIKINIVVQAFIDADYSGVCFSINPLTGNDHEMIIESVKGWGEQLVQGHVTPKTYHVNWYDEGVEEQGEKDENSLTGSMIVALRDTCLDIQQHYGQPQDIEWAIKDEELFILQARPMTAINFDTAYDWTNADLKDGGIASEITTPFMYALYEAAFETTMSPYLKSVNIHPPYEPDKWFINFMLFSYWNLSAVKDGAKKIPGFIERDFDNDLGIEIRYEGKGHVTKISLTSIINGIKILLAIQKSIKETIKNADTGLAALEAILTKNREIDWRQLDNDTFAEKAQELIFTDYLEVEGTYFKVIYNNSNNSTLFKDTLDKKRKKQDIPYLKLIAGLNDVSHLRPIHELWELSQEMVKEEKALAYMNGTSVEELSEVYLDEKLPFFQEKLNQFIQKYGYHSEKELDILTPNWEENPAQVFATLKRFLMMPDEKNIASLAADQKQVFETELAKISSKKFQKAIIKHRYLLWLREEYRDRSTQMYHRIRQVFLEAGKRLKQKDRIAEIEDIFFLSPAEAIHAMTHPSVDIKTRIAKNKIRQRSFRNYERSNEIWSSPVAKSFFTSTDAKDELNGIACSSGLVEGEVYIAHTTADAEAMPEGMIMVTQFTDPAWTVYFSKIKGLITETGGMLSHGAIISREYGIPAVLGVKNAKEHLRTGMKIQLNGDAGMVRML